LRGFGELLVELGELLGALLRAAALALEVLELPLVFVELFRRLRAFLRRRVALFLEQTLALLGELLPALLDGLEAFVALLAGLLERASQALGLALRRRVLLRLELFGELAQRLFGVVEALVGERLRRLARERILLELARDALQAVLQCLAIGLEVLAEVGL